MGNSKRAMTTNKGLRVGLDRDKVLAATHGLQERYVLGNKTGLLEDAKKHLHRGFIVRVMMIQDAAVTLDVELTKAKGPLDSHTAVRLSTLLNSFYLNLAGSLDNLAWALAYQYNLRPGLNERENKHRHFIGLLKKEFTEALRASGKIDLVTHVLQFEGWYDDLRTFRDPGAHRIPLFVPRSIYSEDDVAEQKRLDSEAAKHFSDDRDEDGRAAMHAMFELGAFHPVFIAEVPQIQIYNAGPKVTKDFEQWHALSEFVLADGFGLGKL